MQNNDRVMSLSCSASQIISAINAGLWDMAVIAGEPINPENKVNWSDDFRSMLGFSDETDFLDIKNSS